MENNEKITKIIEKSKALAKRAEAVRKDFEKIRHDIYALTKNLDKHGSAIELETMEDIKSSIYDVNTSMETTIHAMKRITELAILGKCDRYVVTRVKMAVCEVCAAEKEMEVFKEVLKIK